MAKRKRSKLPKGTHRTSGVVYIISIELEGKELYKVGATAGNPRRRVLQITESIEQVYGYFPRCKVLKEEKCKNYYKVEKKVHNMLDEYSYECSERFSGHTELFSCDVGIIIDAYRECIDSDEDVDEGNTFVW